MLRSALLYLSAQPKVFSFVRHNRMAKGFASRFVAGETLDTALDAVAKLNAKRITASLDLLGESVRNESESREAARQYIRILDRIKEKKLDANVSVKLTAMGLDIDQELWIANMQDILERARELEVEASRFEFQMLYGVRRDLQEKLVAEGYRMRVYVPFGTQWYPYLMRRLAERPANVAFITGNVLKEMVGRNRA